EGRRHARHAHGPVFACKLVLEHGGRLRRYRDNLDPRRDQLEREVVPVAREDARAESQAVGCNRRVESRATRTYLIPEVIERDVADGDEFRCRHGVIVSTEWLALPLPLRW